MSGGLDWNFTAKLHPRAVEKAAPLVAYLERALLAFLPPRESEWLRRLPRRDVQLAQRGVACIADGFQRLFQRRKAVVAEAL